MLVIHGSGWTITNDESQQRNVYGSLIDPEERENSVAS